MDAIKTGALIAQARKEKGITQRELAEKVYVSVQAVSKWELGKNFPDLPLMEPLAEALDLTVTELLAGERGQTPGEEAVRVALGTSWCGTPCAWGRSSSGPRSKSGGGGLSPRRSCWLLFWRG